MKSSASRDCMSLTAAFALAFFNADFDFGAASSSSSSSDDSDSTTFTGAALDFLAAGAGAYIDECDTMGRSTRYQPSTSTCTSSSASVSISMEHDERKE